MERAHEAVAPEDLGKSPIFAVQGCSGHEEHPEEGK